MAALDQTKINPSATGAFQNADPAQSLVGGTADDPVFNTGLNAYAALNDELTDAQKAELTRHQRNFYESFLAKNGKAPPRALVEGVKGMGTFFFGVLKGESYLNLGHGVRLVHTDYYKRTFHQPDYIGVQPRWGGFFQRNFQKYFLGRGVNSMEVAEKIMLAAKAEGWRSVVLHGDKREKNRMWLAAKRVGMPIHSDDFFPSPWAVQQWHQEIGSDFRKKLQKEIFTLSQEAKMGGVDAGRKEKLAEMVRAMQSLCNALAVKGSFSIEKIEAMNCLLDRNQLDRMFSVAGIELAAPSRAPASPAAKPQPQPQPQQPQPQPQPQPPQATVQQAASPAVSAGGLASDEMKKDLREQLLHLAGIENSFDPQAQEKLESDFDDNMARRPLTAAEYDAIDKMLDKSEVGEALRFLENRLSAPAAPAAPAPQVTATAAPTSAAPEADKPVSEQEKVGLCDDIIYNCPLARNLGGSMEDREAFRNRFAGNVLPFPMTREQLQAATDEAVHGNVAGAMALVEQTSSRPAVVSPALETQMKDALQMVMTQRMQERNKNEDPMAIAQSVKALFEKSVKPYPMSIGKFQTAMEELDYGNFSGVEQYLKKSASASSFLARMVSTVADGVRRLPERLSRSQ